MKRLATRLLPILLVAGLLLAWTPGGRQAGQTAAGAVTRPFVESWNRVSAETASLLGWVLPGRQSATEEVRALTAALREAEAKLAEVDALRRVYNELRLVLAQAPRTEWRAVAAEVIARDPATWNRGFRIGRGTDHGIVAGSVVMHGRFVLGRVAEAGKASARVDTIGNHSCKLSVALADSGAVGVLWGGGKLHWRAAPECTVNYLPKDVAPALNELVLTSGLGGMVPDGLVVGRVAGPATLHEGAHTSVPIQPAASFRRMNFVVVLSPRESPANP
ncbi:MAG: rod shape-determining protein MreC [Lentisphaeria bacterium]|jgi:rod shape-determining protein MreC|nr:rod shape-determining protein MreC [Lentisphaeria bacterium]